MPKLSMYEAASAIEGDIFNSPGNIILEDFQFDTRLIEDRNTLFFALKTGANDGHNYLHTLAGRQGVCAVVDREFEIKSIEIPMIRVEDTLKAAHKLAVYCRQKYKDIIYIGITGSAGKTTTKEFIYQILSEHAKTCRSYKNWNNWIGLPFSMLKMTGDEKFAVFELAMSYPGIGEIDLLSEILRPDIAVLLNVFPVHLEFLKNLENVARAKSEILNYLEDDDVAFVNGDSDYLVRAVAQKPGHKIFFGSANSMNEAILSEVTGFEKETRMVVDYLGEKNKFLTNATNHSHVQNLFVAISVARYLGLSAADIQKAIRSIKVVDGRGEIRNYQGVTLIDETYNSNPEAVKMVLTWVQKTYKRNKIAVLGDMLELGEGEFDYHIEIGRFFATLDFQFLVTVGQRAKWIAQGAREGGYDGSKSRHFDHSTQVGRFLRKIAEPDAVVILKASRGVKLEQALAEFGDDEAE